MDAKCSVKSQGVDAELCTTTDNERRMLEVPTGGRNGAHGASTRSSASGSSPYDSPYPVGRWHCSRTEWDVTPPQRKPVATPTAGRDCQRKPVATPTAEVSDNASGAATAKKVFFTSPLRLSTGAEVPLPPFDFVSPYLDMGDLCRVVQLCQSALSLMTVPNDKADLEPGQPHRLILAPVLTLTMMNSEQAMQLVSLAHVEVVRIFSRLAWEVVARYVRRNREDAFRMLRRFTAQGTAVNPDDTAGFLEVLLRRKQLVLVNFERNNIRDEGAALLFKAVLPGSTAETLCVRRNHISEDTCQVFGDFLRGNPVLKVLNLKANRVTNDGAAHIASALHTNTNLTLCNLRSQVPCLTDPIAVAFGATLAVNTGLLKLRLRRNKITDKGCMALAEGLKINRTLEELDVQFNRIEVGGGMALAVVLGENRVVQEVHLALNRCERLTIRNGLGEGREALADDARLIFEELPDV